MAYFLGRDVDVYITTENSNAVTASGVWTTTGATGSAAAVSGTGDIHFAFSRDNATYTGSAVKDVTGVDISIGAVDEDITYFGIRSVTKAEIKKETTLSLTAKKSDASWDIIYDTARYGTNNAGSFTANSLRSPTVTTGYRIHVVLKSGDEVFSIPGMCVQSHSVSVNADGTSEQTLEFMSYIAPRIGNAPNQVVLDASDL
jgi:hypothetical protein